MTIPPATTPQANDMFSKKSSRSLAITYEDVAKISAFGVALPLMFTTRNNVQHIFIRPTDNRGRDHLHQRSIRPTSTSNVSQRII